MNASLPPRAFGTTQKDVAEALGLSQSSVALALNPKHQHKLLPETVALVKSKAEEMGYKMTQFARMLREGRTRIIGTVYHSGLYHAPQERVKLLAHSTMKCGYQLIAVDLAWFINDEEKALDYLLGYSPEGVILCNIHHTPLLDWRKQLARHRIPSLFFGSALPYDGNDIGADITGAFENLTRHHLSLCSQKLTLLLPYHDAAYIGWPGTSSVHRAQGFAQAILEAGGSLTIEPKIAEYLKLASIPKNGGPVTGTILYPAKTAAFANTFEMGSHFAKEMIRKGDIPEALLCSNDEIACGAVNAFIRAGIDIPDKVKVSGADNSPYASTCCIPLTSIEQSTQTMAERAIERIVELIEKPASLSASKVQTFPCRLIERESTIGLPAPPKATAPRKPNKANSARKGFTLPELLLAIVIGAILLVLSLSGVNAVRTQQGDVKCLANLRASGQAILSFIHDNNGRFLETSTWFAYPSTTGTRNRSMRDYFGVGNNAAGINDSVFLRDTILTCPAMKAKYPNSYPQPLNRGYGINYYLYLKDGSKELPGPGRIQNVPSLPAMLLLTEAPFNNGVLGSVNENTFKNSKDTSYLSLPHRGKQHLFFFDGHISAFTQDDFDSIPSRRNFWGKLTFTD